MKPLPILLLTLGILGGLSAQDDAIPQMETALDETGIHGAITDGTPTPALPEKPPIPFNVLSSTTKRIDVSESPELPGLPAPQGTINMTMELVEDPGLPPEEKPLPPLVDVSDPAVQEQIREVRERLQATKVLFVSASVYGGTKTLLRVYPEGVGQREVTVISNLDFNDFSGFATFQVKGFDADGADEVRTYGLVMALGNSDSQESSRIAWEHGLEAGDIPDVPAGDDPAFTVIGGGDENALLAVTDLHELYRVEGEKMLTARLARERAYEERKAYLLANPPKPRDVKVRVWSRTSPTPQTR